MTGGRQFLLKWGRVVGAGADRRTVSVIDFISEKTCVSETQRKTNHVALLTIENDQKQCYIKMATRHKQLHQVLRILDDLNIPFIGLPLLRHHVQVLFGHKRASLPWKTQGSGRLNQSHQLLLCNDLVIQRPKYP